VPGLGGLVAPVIRKNSFRADVAPSPRPLALVIAASRGNASCGYEAAQQGLLCRSSMGLGLFRSGWGGMPHLNFPCYNG
jgi:hypothetical protein